MLCIIATGLFGHIHFYQNMKRRPAERHSDRYQDKAHVQRGFVRSCRYLPDKDLERTQDGFLRKKSIREAFKGKLIIFSTCAGSAASLLKVAAAGVKMETVIIDEASQVLVGNGRLLMSAVMIIVCNRIA